MLDITTLRTRIILAACIAVVYFALAIYFERSYVDPRPNGQIAVRLYSPFRHEGGNAFTAWNVLSGEIKPFLGLGDEETIAGDTSSPIIVYENKDPIGPPHSTFADISKIGKGHFAFWNHSGIVFSTSDNSDPNTNGRNYWAVIPFRASVQVH